MYIYIYIERERAVPTHILCRLQIGAADVGMSVRLQYPVAHMQFNIKAKVDHTLFISLSLTFFVILLFVLTFPIYSFFFFFFFFFSFFFKSFILRFLLLLWHTFEKEKYDLSRTIMSSIVFK